MTGVTIKKKNFDIDMQTGRMPCEHEGRTWCDVSISQGSVPKIAGKTPKLEAEPGTDSSLVLSEGAWSWLQFKF